MTVFNSTHTSTNQTPSFNSVSQILRLTKLQHIGKNCFLCNKGTRPSQHNKELTVPHPNAIPMIRIGEYRAYLFCNRKHWSKSDDMAKSQSLLTEFLANSTSYEVPPGPQIKLSPHLRLQWDISTKPAQIVYTCSGISQTNISCMQQCTAKLWIHDFRHENLIRVFCTPSCCLEFLKAKYTGSAPNSSRTPRELPGT